MMRSYIVKQSVNTLRSSFQSRSVDRYSLNYLKHQLYLKRSTPCIPAGCISICSNASQSNSVETDFVSLITNIKLKDKRLGKRDINRDVLWDPNIERRLGSKKRSFLQKDDYAISSFGALKSMWNEEEEDGLSEDESDKDGQERMPIINAKIKPNIKESREIISSCIKTLDVEGSSDKAFFQLLEDTLSSHLVPSMALLKKLEVYCHNRLSKWSNDTILKVCDWWHLMDKLEDVTFKKALNELSSRENLEVKHLVQIFYFVSLYKDPIEVLSKFVSQVEKMLQDLNMRELTIVCEGFLKSRSRIRSKLLAEEVLHRMTSIATRPSSEYHLVTILRFLSRSYERDHNILQEVATMLEPLMSSIHFIAVPHVATSFAKLRCFHHGLYNAIADRAMTSLSDSQTQLLRTKDIWMLLWAFGRLNYSPPDGEVLFDGLVKQMIVQEKSFLCFPMHQLRALVALSFLDIYPLDLINRTFDQTFLKACQECNFPYVYKLLVILDNSLSIERPQYDGNRLPQEFRIKSLSVPHGTTLFTPELRNETKFVIETLTKVLRRSEPLKTSPILPHIRTPVDIEVDLSGEEIPEIPIDKHRLSQPQTLKEGSQRYAILFQIQDNYRFTPRKLLGVHVMKKRQLLQLGYKVVEIPYYEWRPLIQRSEKKRMTYIKRKLKDAAVKQNTSES